jgi:hypothetical protein
MYNEEYEMLCLSENEVDSGEPMKLHSPMGNMRKNFVDFWSRLFIFRQTQIAGNFLVLNCPTCVNLWCL